MNYTQVVLFSFSIMIAAVIGLIRFNKIDPVYYPFIFCMWIAALNEIISFGLAKSGYYTIINNNLYVLAEALLITWQFKRWKFFDRHARIYSFTLLLIIIAWFLENISLSSIHKLGFYFRVLYAFIIVLMSIHTINGVIMNDRGRLLKNPIFLICGGYILFFTYKILVEAFWFYGIKISGTFSIDVYIIFTWINLFVNILFGIAVLCIPLKPRYISL